MSAPPPPVDYDAFRREALRLALARRRDDATALMRWHPSPEGVPGPDEEGPNFTELLLYELNIYEEEIPFLFKRAIRGENPSPVQYWRRRLELERGRRWNEAQELPNWCVRALELPSARVVEGCATIGKQFLLRAVYGDTPAELQTVLRPLGSKLVREIGRELRDASLEPLPDLLRAKWQTVLAEAGDLRGEDLAFHVGVRVLATLFALLSPDERRLAERASLSNVVAVATSTVPLPPPQPPEPELLADICVQALTAAYPERPQ